MYRALISHCHIYIRMILNCPRCTQIKLHSWHHSHWIFFIFHVILESYSNLYGTAYPFLSSRAHIWVLCDSWYLSLIFSFCWRVIVCFCRLYVFICILYSSYDFRFTPSTQCFCTNVVYLLLTGTFCIRLMTFVSHINFGICMCV